MQICHLQKMDVAFGSEMFQLYTRLGENYNIHSCTHSITL